MEEEDSYAYSYYTDEEEQTQTTTTAAAAAGEKGHASYSYESDDEHSSSSSSVELEEPKLKYSRVGADLLRLVQKDAIVYLKASEKFLAVGTSYGMVLITDHTGNLAKEYHAHTSAVNAISIDGAEEYIASCSDDGSCVVSSLYDNETHQYTFRRPVKAVALSPTYKEDRAFVAGGLEGRLVMRKKGWFGRSKDVVIHEGDGAIFAIAWRKSLIAWATPLGIKMYDTSSEARITFIERPQDAPRADEFTCHLVWKADNILIIGWADFVKVAIVQDGGGGSRYAQILSSFRTDYFVGGIAPYGEDLLAVLAYTEEVSAAPEDDGGEGGPGSSSAGGGRKVVETAPRRPELRLIGMDNTPISFDALETHGWQFSHARNYSLAHVHGDVDELLYVVSPKDVVQARARDADDHIHWLMENDKFEQALDAAEAAEASLVNFKISQIGNVILNRLIERGEVRRAAAMLPKILKEDGEAWAEWIVLFKSQSLLSELVDFIPTSRPRLTTDMYDATLSYLLANDHAGLRAVVYSWPSEIYSMEHVIRAVEEVRSRDDNEAEDPILQEVLAKLYTLAQQFDKAVQFCLDLRVGDVFGLIGEHKLFATALTRLTALLDLDAIQTVQLLVDHVEEIAIDSVVNALRSEARFEKDLLSYLHELMKKDPHIASQYHEDQARLYAKHQPEELLGFLKQTQSIPLERAYAVCEAASQYDSMVYLLAKMGNTREALDLIIGRLSDVKYAIRFAQEQGDDDLWDELILKSIEKSTKKPSFLGDLLDHIGGHIKPAKLIRQIPERLPVPRLRDRLVKIIMDYNLQTSLRRGCARILRNDCSALCARFVEATQSGVMVEVGCECVVCGEGVAWGGGGAERRVIVFFCGHGYHDSCLDDVGSSVCVVCRAEESK